MSTTIEQVALAALADLGEESAGAVNAVRWTNERISQVASRKLKHRRKIGSLTIPAAISAGTVTATLGSPNVVGNAAAQTAWTNQNLVGAFLQLNNGGTWYRLLDNTSDGLRLDQNFPYATAAAVSYRIVFRYITLPVEAAFLGHFTLNRLRREILLKAQTQLDLHFTDRVYVSNGAWYYSLFGENEGRKILEFYPYSDQAEYVLFTYWEVPPTLPKEALIPTPFTAHDLKTGIHADIYRYKAATEKDLPTRTYYSNMEARQEAKWADRLGDIMRRDRDVDDLVLLFKSPAPELLVNRNAHTEVYLRGLRP